MRTTKEKLEEDEGGKGIGGVQRKEETKQKIKEMREKDNKERRR
jgi:hypothetical protein